MKEGGPRPNLAMLNMINAQNKFNTANLSFMANINSIEDIKYAYKMCFNLISRKKITPHLLKELLECLAMYAKLIREMTIVDISSKLIDLESDAKKICQIHSLPQTIREEKIQEDKTVDTDFYASAMRRIKKNNFIEHSDYED